MNLQPQPRFALRLGAQRGGWSGIHSAVYFPRQIEGTVQANDCCNAISQYIVLLKLSGGSREDSDAQIAESVDPPNLSKLFAD